MCVIFGLALMQQIQKYLAAEVSRAAKLSNSNEAPPEPEEAAAEWHGYSSSPLVCVLGKHSIPSSWILHVQLG